MEQEQEPEPYRIGNLMWLYREAKWVSINISNVKKIKFKNNSKKIELSKGAIAV